MMARRLERLSLCALLIDATPLSIVRNGRLKRSRATCNHKTRPGRAVKLTKHGQFRVPNGDPAFRFELALAYREVPKAFPGVKPATPGSGDPSPRRAPCISAKAAVRRFARSRWTGSFTMSL